MPEPALKDVQVPIYFKLVYALTLSESSRSCFIRICKAAHFIMHANNKIILTGVKPTGVPHLGNFVGAINPAINLSGRSGVQSYLFIADYHSLTSVHNAKQLKHMTHQVAATWLACGLDPEKTVIYRQSDIPELMELNWILSCLAPKGLMNRAHSYKDKVQKNKQAGKSDVDDQINMGVFNYPILMAADILMFSAAEVPVSQDQLQHLEIARDLARKI